MVSGHSSRNNYQSHVGCETQSDWGPTDEDGFMHGLQTDVSEELMNETGTAVYNLPLGVYPLHEIAKLLDGISRVTEPFEPRQIQ